MAKKCTCGKSPTGYCVGLHNKPDTEDTNGNSKNLL